MSSPSLTIRLAVEDDGPALRRLAERDSAEPLSGVILLAELEGEPRAALALGSGRCVADPFHPTVELVELLAARAAQLATARAPDRRLRPRLRRPARRPRWSRAAAR